ncbi:MAG: deoxyribodipyrimidine photo-lyase [Candidatus Zixiibacteriota bacterium]
MNEINQKRVHLIKNGAPGDGPLVCWMSRDLRINDNWALIYAQQLALKKKKSLEIIFCLVPDFLGATLRQYDFMLKGLKELEKSAAKYNIVFRLLLGQPEIEIPKFISQNKIDTIVTDFSPLKIKQQWHTKIATKINIPFFEVDTHNIVPIWIVSFKQEYAAYTIRPKIQKLLPEFLTHFPKPAKMPPPDPAISMSTDWDIVCKSLKIDRSVPPVAWLKPGEMAAQTALKKFIITALPKYDTERNDPNADAQSNLSPYLHFGQISAQKIAHEIDQIDGLNSARMGFLEELIIRRELSDNFCYYNSDYDTSASFPDWAKRTIREHSRDKRQYLYDLKTFENAETDDPLWNAAQKEMVITGKMHGYMRMYWAKKILEWTDSPETAMKYAVYLNDKYELDGRDPNGYAGIAWSLGGVHDRAWPERPVFGKIRYMNYAGCKRKFDIEQYIDRYKKK